MSGDAAPMTARSLAASDKGVAKYSTKKDDPLANTTDLSLSDIFS